MSDPNNISFVSSAIATRVDGELVEELSDDTSEEHYVIAALYDLEDECLPGQDLL